MGLKPLVIDDLVAKLPIIQGGMGVGISLSGLAGAVANEGAVGIISTAQIGFYRKDFEENPKRANFAAIEEQLAKARALAPEGVIGVNIMTASNNYEEYVKCSVENGAQLIISGAGLPTTLPALVKGSKAKFAPIVSSVKACKVLFSMWEKKYGTTADLVVIEGPKAGGHLGFKLQDLDTLTGEGYDDEVKRIIEFVDGYRSKFDKKIPVVFGGGVYDKADILHYIGLGCDGVQMATRFVATVECDAPQSFKEAYLSSTCDDVGIIKSPVGMPGRALKNKFFQKAATGEKFPIDKCYACISHCDRTTIPYCITQTLVASAQGETENALVFCGENAHRVNEIVTVKELIRELTE